MVREARALGGISDKNLVKVHDAGVYEDQFFMVMELLEGVTLKDLAGGGALPLGVVLTLTQQLAWALHVLHQLGHVHRDVKPDNCMVIEAPGEPVHRLILIDLGVTKFADATTTSEGIALGTITYMAPEQVMGERVDARADIYAMGLIMYELIAGVHALARKSRPVSRTEWMERQRKLVPDPLDQVVKNLNPAVSNLVMRCIAKDPAQRFSSAAELATQLTQLIAMLRHTGQLGAERVQPFERRPPETGESGPQPIARVRPPNTDTPGPGLPFLRTEEAQTPQQPEASPAPLPLRAEPPRVAAHPAKRAPAGTVEMLGPRETRPHLESNPHGGRPRQGTVPMNPQPQGRPRMGTVPMDAPAPQQPSRPRQGTVPMDTNAPVPSPASPAAASKWKPVPADPPLRALEPNDASQLADGDRDQALEVKPAAPVVRSPARSVGRRTRREGDPAVVRSNVGLWLRAMALGLVLAIIALAVIAAIALGRGRSSTPSDGSNAAPSNGAAPRA
ncbi:MAG: protein kinase, partial [Myxococcales bacterium]|nr:protein kinase [Myxococcales bacterium]